VALALLVLARFCAAAEPTPAPLRLVADVPYLGEAVRFDCQAVVGFPA
jgi:hypothetical protein